MDELELLEMLENDQYYASCGCEVEADGICPCGNKSPLLEAGLI